MPAVQATFPLSLPASSWSRRKSHPEESRNLGEGTEISRRLHLLVCAFSCKVLQQFSDSRSAQCIHRKLFYGTKNPVRTKNPVMEYSFLARFYCFIRLMLFLLKQQQNTFVWPSPVNSCLVVFHFAIEAHGAGSSHTRIPQLPLSRLSPRHVQSIRAAHVAEA